MKDARKRLENRRLVEILFVEPERHLRTQFRVALKNENFDGVIDLDSMGQVVQRLEAQTPDLLVIDSAVKGGGLVDLINDVRHGNIGQNPYLPVIVTLWKPTAELVQDLLEAGPDDVLVKPISPGLLLNRIDVLTDNRKPFVVTSDYIGPDRRKEPTRTSSIARIEVPNTLSAKIRGEPVDPAETAKMIARANEAINDQRLKRNAFQVSFLVGLILPELGAGNYASAEVFQHFQSLVRICSDTSERMMGTDYEHISHLCQTMLELAERVVHSGGKPSKRDIELLKPLSDAILTGFHPNKETAAMAGEIASAITGYTRRQVEATTAGHQTAAE